jgi:hypothetical protein
MTPWTKRCELIKIAADVFTAVEATAGVHCVLRFSITNNCTPARIQEITRT